MLRRLLAKCPLGTWEKTWVETRMCWLADQFGIQRLIDAKVVTPTDEFFPDSYQGTSDDARQLMVRLCGHMGINPAGVELEVCLDAQLPGAVGHYDASSGTTIRLAEAQLAEPMQLVATLAHELAHVLLLGGGFIAQDKPDHEWITDLLPVFLGVGIFAANATIVEQQISQGNWFWWSMGKQGYLPSRMLGYAMALFAFARSEYKPDWAKYLRLDAASALWAGLRYLQKNGESLFPRRVLNEKSQPAPLAKIITQLADPSPSTRLAALWEVRERSLADSDVVGAVQQCLGDRDPAIPPEAASALAALGPKADSALPRLRKALWDKDVSTRASAAHALGALRLEPDTVVPEIASLLGEPNRQLVLAASAAIREFGTLAERVAPRMLTVLRRALIECDYELVEKLVGTLAAISADPRNALGECLQDADADLRRFAMQALKEEIRRSQKPLPPPPSTS